MKNELQGLRTLIVQPIIKHFVNHEQRKLEFKHECILVKDAILRAVFSSDSTVKTTAYLQYHHRELILILDQFYAMRADIIFADALLLPMVELLHYLEMHFKVQLDPNAMICQFDLVQFQLAVEARKLNLLKNLRKKTVHPSLINVIADYLKHLEMEENLSYSAFHYHQTCIAEIEKLGLKKLKANGTEQLMLLLGRLNFNGIAFMTYCRNVILEAVQQLDRKEAQLDLLAIHLKRIKLIQLQPNMSLNPDLPNLITILSSWINEERVFIESRKVKQQLVNKEALQQEKIEVGLSVAQLALMIKVLLIEGILVKTNVSKLLTFFTTFFRTQHTSQISADSFRNNYYDVEASTISSLKGKLIGVVNALNRMK